jgi:hypothetical protein
MLYATINTYNYAYTKNTIAGSTVGQLSAGNYWIGGGAGGYNNYGGLGGGVIAVKRITKYRWRWWWNLHC